MCFDIVNGPLSHKHACQKQVKVTPWRVLGWHISNTLSRPCCLPVQNMSLIHIRHSSTEKRLPCLKKIVRSWRFNFLQFNAILYKIHKNALTCALPFFLKNRNWYGPTRACPPYRKNYSIITILAIDSDFRYLPLSVAGVPGNDNNEHSDADDYIILPSPPIFSTSQLANLNPVEASYCKT